jgi:predicted metallo-beta-lactamase superfamily hydrolase
MAASSSSPSDKKCYSGLKAPDAKVAKNAIAKAAKALRTLLANDEEKLEILIQHGLLRDKNAKSVTKELQETVVQEPASFWVLLREIEKFADGAEAAKKLEGTVEWSSKQQHYLLFTDNFS